MAALAKLEAAVKDGYNPKINSLVMFQGSERMAYLSLTCFMRGEFMLRAVRLDGVRASCCGRQLSVQAASLKHRE